MFSKRLKTIAAAVLALTLVICMAACGAESEAEPDKTAGWLASDGSMIQLYHMDEETKKTLFGKVKRLSVEFVEDISVGRGTEVTLVDKPETDEEGNVLYEQLLIGDTVYYVQSGCFVDDYKKIITEDTKYVRTSVTLYQSPDDVKIAGFARKGSKLDVIGFDTVDENGAVNMYKVRFKDTEGYVFGKYLVDTQEDADKAYNEHGEADFHHNAVYNGLELYGGSPDNLDWYPYEFAGFEDNKFCEDVRAMYIGVGASPYYQGYVDCALQNGCTAVVIDIFDDVLGFDSEASLQYCPTAYNFANAYRAFDTQEWANMVKAFNDAGIYTIGRIVCFKDDYYVTDHPENCILYHGSVEWPSAFSRGMWEYKVSLAVEAVEKFGFNEIQLDYVRFPEATYAMSCSGDADFRNVYGEDKCEAVQNFVFYAADMIHRAGAYVSVDVFGESSNGYVTSYGQYWPAISNIADATSAMPYTDHFGDIPYYWTHPYDTLYNWGRSAAVLQEKIPTPGAGRTWVTAYDTPYWEEPENRVYYGANAVADQAQGLWDAGLIGGFMTWNISCSLSRYYEIGWAWAHDYSTTRGTVYY